MIKLDICICTHNPRFEVLAQVMTSIHNQKFVDENTISVMVIDNASSPPITESVFEPFNNSMMVTKLVQEPSPGIAKARAAAANATSAEWVLFVDDDNELNSDYVLNGFRVIRDYPEVGCFGGKLLLPENIQPYSWSKPFLPYLGIKNYGDQRVERISEHWGIWEPPTAGCICP